MNGTTAVDTAHLIEDQKKHFSWTFFKQVIKNPLSIGAICPSSKYLANAMLDNLDFPENCVFVEYGPGTGSFTALAAKKLPKSARMILVEINPRFQDILRHRFPKAEIVDNIATIMDSVAGRADFVVSGLPFTTMPWDICHETMSQTRAIIKEGGVFRTFLYHHTAPLPRNRRLMNYASSLMPVTNKVAVYKNIPPAIVLEFRG